MLVPSKRANDEERAVRVEQMLQQARAEMAAARYRSSGAVSGARGVAKPAAATLNRPERFERRRRRCG